MHKFLMAIGGSFLLLTATAQAQGFSEASLDRFTEVQDAFGELDKQYPATSSEVASFEGHCNWQQHYETLKAGEDRPDVFWREAERLFQSNGISPSRYLELMLKSQWPVANDAVEQMSEHPWASADIAGAGGADSANEQLREMMESFASVQESFQQMHAMLDKCMTDAEKELATRLFEEQHPIYRDYYDDGDDY